VEVVAVEGGAGASEGAEEIDFNETKYKGKQYKRNML
jgi:hypothetical protein